MEKLCRTRTYFPSFCTRQRWWEGGALKFNRNIHNAYRGVNQSTPRIFFTCCSRTLPLQQKVSILTTFPFTSLYLNYLWFCCCHCFFVCFTGAAICEVSVAEAGNLLPADHSPFQFLPPCRCPRALVLWHQDLPQLHGLQSHLGRVRRGNSSGFGMEKSLYTPKAICSWPTWSIHLMIFQKASLNNKQRPNLYTEQ